MGSWFQLSATSTSCPPVAERNAARASASSSLTPFGGSHVKVSGSPTAAPRPPPFFFLGTRAKIAGAAADQSHCTTFGSRYAASVALASAP